MSPTDQDDGPPILASIGRGMMDSLGDPLRQAWANMQVWNPGEADRMRRLLRDEEQLYRKRLEASDHLGFDPWRAVGRTAMVAPSMSTPAAMLNGFVVGQGLESFDTIRRNLHKYEALARSLLSKPAS